MIKKIHYCWFGKNPLPKDVQEVIETWKKYLPDYEIIQWNEDNFDINTSTFVKEAYENKKWAFVSDYVRIYALYKEGGIYFDTDMKVLKDVSKIVDKEMFLGYEDSGYVGTAVLGVNKTKNKYLKEILDYYNNIEHFNVEIIYNYANPLIITKTLKKYKSEIDKNGITIVDGKVYIYPRDYFFPISYDYSEKVYTDNTCMEHLFKATWTDKRDQRIVNINKMFGRNWGRRINSLIDKSHNFKERIKTRCVNIYKKIRLKASIKLNIDKRVDKIKENLKKVKGDYIVVSHPDNAYTNDNIKGMFDDNIVYIREQYTDKEARLIAEELVKKRKLIIFNSLENGWDRLINIVKELSNKIQIKVIINNGDNKFVNDDEWGIFQKTIDLYNKHKIDVIGTFDEDLCKFLNEKYYKTQVLKKKIIGITNKEEKSGKDITRIGLYRTSENDVYNELFAISKMENIVLDCNPINYKISMCARFFNINISGDTGYVNLQDLIDRLSKNDINLFIQSCDDNSILPIASLESNTICLTGQYELFRNTELEKYTKVNNPNDINEIFEKIKYSLENKQIILESYAEWKKEYTKECEKSLKEFIKI